MKTNAKLYVMRAEDGSIKLGYSSDPARRAKQFGRPVEILHETDVIEHVDKIEKLAHRVLALHGSHLRGEWFEATLADALLAIEIATRQAENQELSLGGKLKRSGYMTPRPAGELVQINIRVDDDVLAAVEDIRSMSRPIPSVSKVWRDAILNERDRMRRKVEVQRKAGIWDQ